MGSKFNSEQTMEIEGSALDGGSKSEERTYLCIDLKSFYASVECADRGLDPFTTNLVVADPTRSANTICLAITPALKAQGVKNRCRLGDIPDGIEFTCAMPRMSRYMEVSANIVGTYQRFVSADDMHVYSIDESFYRRNAIPEALRHGCEIIRKGAYGCSLRVHRRHGHGGHRAESPHGEGGA